MLYNTTQLIKRLLNFLRRKSSNRQNTPTHYPDTDIVRVGNASLAKFNMDDLEPDEQQAFRSAASEVSNIMCYEGHVEHGYALSFVFTPQRCPRCNTATRQCYANFIYATQVSPRVMFAPAGYFCTQCPTVVIDEEVIKSGIIGNFKFQGVVGLHYDERQQPDFFRTWNGEDTVYILDEDQTPQGITTIKTSQLQRQNKPRHKSSKRNRMAKKSRKRNQHKKYR